MSQAKRKVVVVGAKAKEQVLAGANAVADAVKLTYGPYGGNFASGVRGGPIHISNDGVSLAKEMVGSSPDEIHEIGLRAVVEAATKTNDMAGDGTTAAVILTQAILGVFKLDADIVRKFEDSPIVIRRKIEGEAIMVVNALADMAEKVDTQDKLIEVAKVSVEDEALAELIGGAQWQVGKFGTVLAEEHNAPGDEVEYIHGIRFDNGFTTSRIITNQEKQALELSDVHVIVTNHVFNTAKTITDLKPLFDQLVAQGTKGVVLIGRAFDDTAIGVCVKNIQNGFPLFPINAPYTDQDEVMEDLAAAVGGNYVKAGDRKIYNIVMGDVGFATKVFAKRFEAVIAGKPVGADPVIDAAVDKRVVEIEEKLKGQVTPFEQRMLEARLSQMKGGTAVIKVGAQTEQERKYKKDKVDDAVNAVKAAIQEGVVPGGGMALKTIAGTLPEGSLLAEALTAPWRQIMTNAGQEFEIEAWVKDPLKVVRTGFQKAVSIACSLATTEVAINFEREKPMWVKQAEDAQVDDE